MSIENKILNEIKANFNQTKEEAEVSLLLLQLRAENLDISFEDYIKTYHPQGFAEKDNSLADEYKGYVQFLSDDAKALIRCGQKADFSTFIHENAHIFRRQLSGELKEKAENLFKVQNGIWSEAQEEAFAIGFEEYVRYRLAQTEAHKDLFEKGSLFMQRAYNGLDRIVTLHPELIKIYDELFTESRFHFNQTEFEKAIQTIHSQNLEQFKSSHLYLGMTPPIYQELGFERLPVMMSAHHLKTVMQDWGSDRNANYHGLTPDVIAQIPEAIKKPLLIMQSQHKTNAEDIITVVELKDKNGNPIIIPLSPNKKGYFNDAEIDINLAKTIYGRKGFNDFLMRAIKENRILYLNEKSRELTIPEIQFLRNRNSQLMYDNIAKYKEIVKQTYPNFGKLYQKVYHGSRYDFDEFNAAYIGTGEGASGWGYGFYFSESKADAADYARKLEYEDGDGRVYTVSIPSTRHFLDISRDMYLKDQSEEVQRSLKKLNKILKDTTTSESLSSHANTFFKQLQEEFDTEYTACEYLKKVGIKGITHTEFGNRHFIVFDDENIKISKKQHLKNIRVLYQKSAYYSGGQIEFDFLNDPAKKPVETIIEKAQGIQKQEHNEDKSIILKNEQIKIINNTELKRVQIFFPVAPNEQIRSDLKSHGWKWSPRNFCWQRLNTENGITDAKRFYNAYFADSVTIEEEHNKTEFQHLNKEHLKQYTNSTQEQENERSGQQQSPQTNISIGKKFSENIKTNDSTGSRRMGNSYVQKNENGNYRREYQVSSGEPRNGFINNTILEEVHTQTEIKNIRNAVKKILEKSDLEITEADKKILAQYEGAGGLSTEQNRTSNGVLYEFYTPSAIVNKVWELVDSYAPNAKTVLEPAGGSGRFVLGRDKNKCTLIEVDSTSSRIASILQPNVTVKNQAFQELFFENGIVHKTEYDGEKFDVVIGNPPYGQYSGLYKGRGEGQNHSRYEEYFVERGLDTLYENGILAFIMPSSFLRNGESKAKQLIAEKGSLVDAWRLPNGVFNTTDVGVDIVIIKKEKGNVKEFCNDEFFNSHRNHILGQEFEEKGRWGVEKKIKLFSGENIENALHKIKPQEIHFNSIAEYIDIVEQPKVHSRLEKLELGGKIEKKEVQTNIVKEILNAEEFAYKYGKKIDKKELPIWRNTDYEGKINEATLSQESIDFINKNPNYVNLNGSIWMHTVNYTKGNIYEKLEELEQEKPTLPDDIYLNRKRILEASIPKKIPYEKISIPVHSALAEEFIVGKNIDGTTMNLKEGFIHWARGTKKEYELLEEAKKLNYLPFTSFLDFEYSPLTKEDFIEADWSDVVNFVNRIPVRAESASDNEGKAAAQIQAQKLRVARRETSEKLFNRYIQEGVPENLKNNLEYIWNKRFNGSVNPDYSKFPLFIDGMSQFKDNEPFTLYEQQIKGISFLSDKGNGLLAYDVGVGKTACGIAATVNQIQTGKAKRPLICVPKSVYSKWIRDTKELFPNIQVNDLENFNEKKLAPFFIPETHGLNIPENSISICTNEALQNITFLKNTIDTDLATDLIDARANTTGDAWLEAKEKEKIYEILGAATKAKENYILWENTEFDHITVDEAHRFKNLFTMPHVRVKDDKNNNNKQTANEFEGIGSGVPSNRAQKLFAITQTIQRKNNGRNVFLLTATPFTNSPTEVYSMLSYIARQKLKDMHLYNLNSFMTEFAETKTEWTVKPNGEIKPKQVMKNFNHLPALQNLLTQYIDKVDAEEAGVIRPKKITHAIELQMNKIQKQIIETETQRMENLSKEDPGGMLVAMNNMRMAILSPALVNPANYSFKIPSTDEIVESSPKLTFACNSIIESYKKEPLGGQVMYMPRGVPEFEKIKAYFIKHGIPKEAIALIDSSTSNAKKDEITKKFNDKTNRLKIIIGSETIGEGIDLNGNSFALYNCMLGWNPTESTQVEGRIWRQGNEQGIVHIIYPLIDDSIDSLMYQKHDEKSSRINALWSYKGDKLNVEDIHPEELKFDLIKDPTKRANLIIDQKTADYKKDISVIDAKIKTIDEIIELKKHYNKQLSYATITENKSGVKKYKNKLANLDKKAEKLDIKKESDQYKKIAKLNLQKKEIQTRIDSIKNTKQQLIDEIKLENTRQNKNLLSLDEIISNNVSSIVNNLCPAENIKKTKNDRNKMYSNSKLNTQHQPIITNTQKQSPKRRIETGDIFLKNYIQTEFDFSTAEKISADKTLNYTRYTLQENNEEQINNIFNKVKNIPFITRETITENYTKAKTVIEKYYNKEWSNEWNNTNPIIKQQLLSEQYSEDQKNAKHLFYTHMLKASSAQHIFLQETIFKYEKQWDWTKNKNQLFDFSNNAIQVLKNYSQTLLEKHLEMERKNNIQTHPYDKKDYWVVRFSGLPIGISESEHPILSENQIGGNILTKQILDEIKIIDEKGKYKETGYTHFYFEHIVDGKILENITTKIGKGNEINKNEFQYLNKEILRLYTNDDKIQKNQQTGINKNTAANNTEKIYTTLQEIAKVLQFDKTQINLNSNLKIRYLPSAKSIFYQTKTKEIIFNEDINKNNIAHEWFHALDNITYPMITKDNKNIFLSEQKNMKGEIAHRFEELVRAMTKNEIGEKTAFLIAAEQLDKQSGNTYWALPHEMAARSFTAYFDGKINPSHSSCQNRNLYPQGKEKINIDNAFDKLFETYRSYFRQLERTKETKTNVRKNPAVER